MFQQKKIIFLLTIGGIIIFSFIFLASYNNHQVSAQGDWLTGWNYRKEITITGATGAGTDYQVKLKVGESSGSVGYDFDVEGHSAIFPSGENDSGDLRFTDNDGTTLLPFWVESVTGTSPNRTATIWVKVKDDLSSDVNIYCYYGNTSATNVSDGTNTWDYFLEWTSDHTSEFSSAPPTDRGRDTNRYISLGKSFSAADGYRLLHYSTVSYVDIANRYGVGVYLGLLNEGKTYDNDGASDYIANSLYVDTDYSPKDWSTQLDSRKSSTGATTQSTSDYAHTIGDWRVWEQKVTSFSVDTILYTSSSSSNIWFSLSLDTNIADNSLQYLGYGSNHGDYASTNDYWLYDSTNKAIQWGAHASGRCTIKMKNKWVAVGKYVSPEPTWASAGPEEAPGPVNNPPNAPTNPSPSDGEIDVSINPTLSVNVSDPDGGTLDVSFYDASDNSLIGTDSGVASGEQASVSWDNRKYNTTYTWYVIVSDGTDSTQSAEWSFTTTSAPNNPPNTPTLVSPADGSTISDDTPTLSAHYSDSDSGDTGITHYRISSSSLSDCVNNINVIAWGDSAETSTNDEDTSWTPSSSIGPDSTYYWCAQNDDGEDTSNWTEMGNFTLSTASSDNCQHHNVYGWAWSERAGWISFSCENTGADIDYGVDIDPDTGEMSGYAWSERVGYISFNSSDLSGCPSGTCEAKVDLDTGKLSGWAKAINTQGWDGWIKLSGTTQDNNPYGVSIDISGDSPYEFSGWAWSDDTIGWISSNCSNQNSCSTSDYKVLTDLSFVTKPLVSNPHETWAYCSDSLHPTLNWDYSDGNSSGYEVQIATDNAFNNIILDYTSDTDNSTSYHPSSGCPPFSNVDCDLSFGTTYYWRIRAKNQNDVWSDWSDIDSFSTPSHTYPHPNFYLTPSSPKIGEVTQFTDQTTWGSGAIEVWNWNIPDSTYKNGTSSSSQNPVVIFNSEGTKTVTLQVTDTTLNGSGDCGIGCCEVSNPVQVRTSLKPHWHEEHP